MVSKVIRTFQFSHEFEDGSVQEVVKHTEGDDYIVILDQCWVDKCYWDTFFEGVNQIQEIIDGQR